jgi:hypothetical protein
MRVFIEMLHHLEHCLFWHFILYHYLLHGAESFLRS